MQLEYHYLVFEDNSEKCPGELFESILRFLKVVFAVYGYKQCTPGDNHDMHVICEDDSRRSLYWNLPLEYKDKITKKRVVVNGIRSFTRKLKPILLDDDDLCVTDNTLALFGELE